MTANREQEETAGRAAMPGSALVPGAALVLGIDTCGPTGSVALARVSSAGVEVLGQTELAGRSYSATLVAAVGELLSQAQTELEQLKAIVVVNGPGSFTGVRVGVSATKGLAEGHAIGVVPVSRLEVLAGKADAGAAALDAHRGEVFLRTERRELLAGKEELAAVARPQRIAICDEAAAALLQAAWSEVELARSEAPTAADAILLCAERVSAGVFADAALLDGHYLRRSDAEIFGDPGARAKSA
jgi:tRNA threonylcarbamoyladenosine biosynthesis protein TsaB